MDRHVLKLNETGAGEVALVGGKGASLGELSRIDGIEVPPGFCVTTEAWRQVVGESGPVAELPRRLARFGVGDTDELLSLGAGLRAAVLAAPIPGEIEGVIVRAVGELGEGARLAVRSSAIDEDRAGSSFAGQHESYLDVVGPDAVLEHVKRCWASLFTERALNYRLRNGLTDQVPAMGVVVQEMVAAKAAGVMFTADPATSNRKVIAIEAVAGLGEEFVSGRVIPDSYSVNGREVKGEVRGTPVLGTGQVHELARLGRLIESHFGRPQDIEWCLADGRFAFVQSRPITTLYPVPAVTDDGPHVYVSVGHQQMMTDAMKPLGISFWEMTTPREIFVAGNRLFVDVAETIASPAGRAGVLAALAESDPLIGDALATVIERGFVPSPPGNGEPAVGPGSPAKPDDPVTADPAITAALVETYEASIAELEEEIEGNTGSGLIDFIEADIEVLRANLFDPESMRLIVPTLEATAWLNRKMKEWLGEVNAADGVVQSVSGNPAAEMGLRLLEVADVIRPHRQLVLYLEETDEDDFLNRMEQYEGGKEARQAIDEFLERYGSRCVGEIDITRIRWSERPLEILPLILQNVRHAEPGAAKRQIERGLRAAEEKERSLLRRLRELPDGERKAEQARRRIGLLRAFTGYREYPKFAMIRRYFIYKKALLREAGRQAAAGRIDRPDDIFFLDFGELRQVVSGDPVDRDLIERRKREYESNLALRPPRVMTSEGEVLNGAYRRDDLPAGALAGLAVSSGTVEGRARVVHRVSEADLEPDEILVTAFTDPSWSPVFLRAAGLVTEVGGLMTHGAVVAREYGLPAVVGLENATSLIRDGQLIRLNGTEGWVEIL